jgi:hypothetical protein
MKKENCDKIFPLKLNFWGTFWQNFAPKRKKAG